MRQNVQQEYYTTTDIATILGCGRRQAYNIAITLPYTRTMNKRGSAVRVKIDDFKKYLEEHTVQPDQFQPRCTPFPTLEAKTKAWHKGR